MGLAADALVASFNPQLAAWSHNPFAVEIEQHLVRALGSYFSYSAGVVDRVFASSGMKHNHTAILAALTNRFPEFATKRPRALWAQPVFCCSFESDHFLLKAARCCGFGMDSMRHVEVDF